MEQILEGNLACFEVTDLLTFLNMGQRTGVLVFERPEQETKVFLREGKPVYATSTRTDLRLGSMLVRQGRLSAEEVDRLLRQQVGGGYRLGQALLNEKVLSQEELATYLKIQVSEVIFDTFGWRAGRFAFFDRIPPPASAVTLAMDLQNLIMEGVRRIDVRGRLAEVFPDLNLVVEAVANPERVKASVTLTQLEWQVFFLIDGRRSLADICRLAGNPDELATLEVLHRLVVAKFVALAPPRPETPAPAPAAAPAPGDMFTQRFVDESSPTPAQPVSVEFIGPLLGRKLEDDTKEIVSRQAVQYLAAATKVIVSRLTLFKDGAESSFPLTRDAYTLGRHRNNDIVIGDPKVSSFHARIDRSPEGFAIVDLKSRNGTYVNGKRVEGARLKNGDEVRLGTARMIYKVDYTSSVS